MPRAVVWVSLLVLTAATALRADPPPPATQPAPAAAPSKATPIRGQVVDQARRPVVGTNVRGSTNAMGRPFWSCVEVITRTDADGRFTLEPIFDGIRYDITVQGPAHSTPWSGKIAGDTEPLVIRVATVPCERKIDGMVFDDSGRLTPEVRVDLIGEMGFAARTQTDEQGRFTFAGLPQYNGQTVVIARSETAVSSPLIIRTSAPAQQTINLVLLPPASINGVATDADDDTPIQGATLTLRHYFSRGLAFTSVSDHQGRYAFAQLPPGEYEA